MKRPLWNCWRWTNRLSLLATTSLVLVFIISLWWRPFLLFQPRSSVTLMPGAMMIYWEPETISQSLFERRRSVLADVAASVIWKLRHSVAADSGMIVLPLWPFAGATFAVMALTCRAASRRHRPAGCCQTCGYDRRGIPSNAPCPECGNANVA